MGQIVRKNNSLPTVPTTKPDNVETFAGKHTARVTKTYNQPDGSISDKIEHRHM